MSYLQKDILSLKDMAITQIAIDLCHRYPDLKNEFFNAKNQRNWKLYAEETTMAIFGKIFLPCSIYEKIVSRIWIIGFQWFNWVMEHTKTFALNREFCERFLIPEDWTEQAILKEIKVAERLVQNKTIDNYKRYRIACHYNLEPFIIVLWKIIPNSLKEMYLRDEITFQTRETCLDHFISYAGENLRRQISWEDEVSDAKINCVPLGESILNKKSSVDVTSGNLFPNKIISKKFVIKNVSNQESSVTKSTRKVALYAETSNTVSTHVKNANEEISEDIHESDEFACEGEKDIAFEESIDKEITNLSSRGEDRIDESNSEESNDKNYLLKENRDKVGESSNEDFTNLESTDEDIEASTSEKITTDEEECNINKLEMRKDNIWCNLLNNAISLGRRVAVRYFWRKLKDKSMLVQSTFYAVNYWLNDFDPICSTTNSWTAPAFYYNDIIFFLISEMSEEQQVTFYQKCFEYYEEINVLNLFLDWSYQNYFLPTIRKLWSYLPENVYLCVLSDIQKRYENRNCPAILDQNCDYLEMILLLLEETPEKFKDYMCADKNYDMLYKKKHVYQILAKEPFDDKYIVTFKRLLSHATLPEEKGILYNTFGRKICYNLILRKDLYLINTVLDECIPNGKLIDLKYAFIISDRGRSFCNDLIRTEDWKTFIAIITECLPENEVTLFKKHYIFSDLAYSICANMIKLKSFNKLHRVLTESLSTGEIITFKKKFIFSDLGHSTCVELIIMKDLTTLSSVLKEFVPAAELTAFKYRFIFSKLGVSTCAQLVSIKDLKALDNLLAEFLPSDKVIQYKKKFLCSKQACTICFLAVLNGDEDYAKLLLNWGLFSEYEMMQFKSKLIFEKPFVKYCKKLVLENRLECVDRIMQWFIPDGEPQKNFKITLVEAKNMDICHRFLKESKWEQLEQLLSWCFTSEEALEYFRQKFYVSSDIDLYSKSVFEGLLEQTNSFLREHNFSEKAIINFKKHTMMSSVGISRFADMLSTKLENVASCLRWGFNDEETLNAFQAKFYKAYSSEGICNINQLVLKELDNAIQKRMKELKNESCDIIETVQENRPFKRLKVD